MPHTRAARRQWRNHIITPGDVDRDNRAVVREMESLGLWSRRLETVEVFWVPASVVCYGWYQGSISIPGIAGVRLLEFIRGRHTSLRDVLRHEWAHAVADHRPAAIGAKRFTTAFGGSYQSDESVSPYDPDLHLTRYAASSPCEDFAEVFHFYLKHKGRLPLRLRNKPAIVRKWEFVAGLARRRK